VSVRLQLYPSSGYAEAADEPRVLLCLKPVSGLLKTLGGIPTGYSTRREGILEREGYGISELVTAEVGCDCRTCESDMRP
jgi:hypothetical protein